MIPTQPLSDCGTLASPDTSLCFSGFTSGMRTVSEPLLVWCEAEVGCHLLSAVPSARLMAGAQKM